MATMSGADKAGKETVRSRSWRKDGCDAALCREAIRRLLLLLRLLLLGIQCSAGCGAPVMMPVGRAPAGTHLARRYRTLIVDSRSFFGPSPLPVKTILFRFGWCSGTVFRPVRGSGVDRV